MASSLRTLQLQPTHTSLHKHVIEVMKGRPNDMYVMGLRRLNDGAEMQSSILLSLFEYGLCVWPQRAHVRQFFRVVQIKVFITNL